MAGTAETLILHAEALEVGTRRVIGDTVRVSTRTRVRDEVVDETLVHERVEIERVAVDRIVDAVPPVRQEGDVTVLSVVEEVLVLERRLVLKEEVRVRRVQVMDTHRETVALREQVVEVNRDRTGRVTDPAGRSGTGRNHVPQTTKENRMSASSLAEQTIVAVYDTPAHAELAVQDLLQAHVPSSAIERHTEAGSYLGETAGEPVKKPGGFLSGLFGTDTHSDATTYTESMSRGGTVVTVHGIPYADFERVAAILETHHPVEFNESGAAPVAGAMTGMGAGTTAAPLGDTLQLSEESLVVGKRLVNRGGTRIRRYVVETPVEEQVSLHDERVVVDRRPVADGRMADASAFADNDRVIEMTETTEQAVGRQDRPRGRRGQPP